MKISPWMPPLAWMGVILTLSTDFFSPLRTGLVMVPMLHELLPAASPGFLNSLHFALRKTAHFMEYAVLSLLWYRAFVRSTMLSAGRAAAAALLIAMAWAGCDEAFQAFMPARSARLVDVMIDDAGAVVGVTVALGGRRTRMGERVVGKAEAA